MTDASPPFTFTQLKKAIPKHCFKPNTAKSLAYFFLDLSYGTALIVFGYMYLLDSAPFWIWPFYCLAIAMSNGALFVIGHDCGHGAFSTNKTLNDAVGFFCHTVALIPYYSWAYTHYHHHSHTGDLDKDVVHVPYLKEEADELFMPFFQNLLEKSFWMDVGRVIFYLLCAAPMHFIMYAWSGKEYQNKGWLSMYDPNCLLFTDKDYFKIVLSNIALLITLGVVVAMGFIFGWKAVILLYLIPVMMNHIGQTQITRLHHIDMKVPWYRGEKWNWLKGACSTIDRNYGIVNYILHDIGNTHVAHHIFPGIPHYYMKEVAQAIKPIMGDWYREDNTPIIVATWRSFRDCRYVDEEKKDEGTYWFK